MIGISKWLSQISWFASVPRDQYLLRQAPNSGQHSRQTDIEGKELRWTTLHPEHWTVSEVSSWVEYVCKEHLIEAEKTASLVTAFDDVNGPRILEMTREEFLLLSSEHGELLFSVLQKMINSVPRDQTTITQEPSNTTTFKDDTSEMEQHDRKQDLEKNDNV